MEARPSVDIDLRKERVQDLSSREAVAAFFATLGHDTSARTPQRPANLGIAAEGLVHQTKHCELIGDQGIPGRRAPGTGEVRLPACSLGCTMGAPL